MERRRALTLVEMLVVIAIVTLLASLAYPAFVEARAGAKRARSMSNMRQLSASLNLYCQNEPGEGPNRLGLPHQPQKWMGTLPRELLVPGGDYDASGGRLVPASYYKILIPIWNDDGTLLSGDHHPWHTYVEQTGHNPVWLLDQSYPGNIGVMKPRRHIGAALDGSIRVKWLKGVFTDALENWR